MLGISGSDFEKLSPAGKAGAQARLARSEVPRVGCFLSASARLGHPPQPLGFLQEQVLGCHATEHTWSPSSPGPRPSGRLEASSLVWNLLILRSPWPFLGYDLGFVEFLSEHSSLSSLRVRLFSPALGLSVRELPG